MSKGLEVLKEIELKWQYGVFTFIPNFEIIEKELKVLEIIKEKKVDIVAVCWNDFDLEKYNEMHEEKGKLNKEEYKLLKEVLINE